MTCFFRISILFVTFFLLFVCFFVLNSSYDQIESLFLTTLGRPELSKHFEQAFSVSKFAFLKYFLIAFTIIYSVFAVFLYQKTFFIIKIIQEYWIIIRNDALKFIENTNNIETKEWYLLVFILLATLAKSVYFASTMPISYDEAWTYNYFSSQFPLLAAFYDPCPNNHILFSLISSFFEKIPLLSPTFAIRLPSILASFLAFYLFFSVYFRYKT